MSRRSESSGTARDSASSCSTDSAAASIASNASCASKILTLSSRALLLDHLNYAIATKVSLHTTLQRQGVYENCHSMTQKPRAQASA